MKKYAIFMGIMLVICWGIFFYQIRPEKPAVTTPFSNMINATVLIYDGFGHGSGVFIEDNMILTAAHCLRDKDFVNIELSDGTILESSDFYIDEKEDIGFIFVDAKEPYIAKVSDVFVGIGDTVFLVGSPYDEEFKFSFFKGIISHLDRDIPRWDWSDLLQVDADSGTGNSGGPLYNVKGHLIGMYVGQCNGGGKSISLCESAKSILEAYERYKDAINIKGYRNPCQDD